jgi:hypothetical protein
LIVRHGYSPGAAGPQADRRYRLRALATTSERETRSRCARSLACWSIPPGRRSVVLVSAGGRAPAGIRIASVLRR